MTVFPTVRIPAKVRDIEPSSSVKRYAGATIDALADEDLAELECDLVCQIVFARAAGAVRYAERVERLADALSAHVVARLFGGNKRRFAGSRRRTMREACDVATYRLGGAATRWLVAI